MLKQSLQQKLLQKLSPLQIQVIKLLEIPTAQLEQRIKEELEVNPVLEYAGDLQGSNDEYGDEADSVPEQEMERMSCRSTTTFATTIFPPTNCSRAITRRTTSTKIFPFRGGPPFMNI